MHQCIYFILEWHLCDSPSHSTRLSTYHGRPEPQQRWYGCENLEVSEEWRHKDSVLHKPPRRKSRMGLYPGTGVATALTRHLLFLCDLSTFVASFDWDTLARLRSEPESRLVERCNHYCLYWTVASASFLTCFMDLWITLYRHSLMEAALPVLLTSLIIPFCSLHFFLLSLSPNLQREKCCTSHVKKNLQSMWFLRHSNFLYPYGTAIHHVSPTHQVAFCSLWPHLRTMYIL